MNPPRINVRQRKEQFVMYAIEMLEEPGSLEKLRAYGLLVVE